jgi:hypothetical protein
MYENFYQYLCKKNNKINNKKKRLLQKGGSGSLADMQFQLAKLNALTDTINDMIAKGKTVNFDTISAPIEQMIQTLGADIALINKNDIEVNKKMSELETKITTFTRPTITGSDFDDLIGKFDSSIATIIPTNDYLNITISKVPKLLFQSINIPYLQGTHNEIVDAFDKQLTEYDTDKYAIDTIHDEEFTKKLQEVKESIAKLDVSFQKIKTATAMVISKNNEINEYTKVKIADIDIKNEKFMESATAGPIDTIQMQKLNRFDIPKVGDDASTMEEFIKKGDNEFKNIDSKFLVRPEDFKFASVMVGGYKNFTKQETDELMKIILNIWKENIDKIKNVQNEKLINAHKNNIDQLIKEINQFTSIIAINIENLKKENYDVCNKLDSRADLNNKLQILRQSVNINDTNKINEYKKNFDDIVSNMELCINIEVLKRDNNNFIVINNKIITNIIHKYKLDEKKYKLDENKYNDHTQLKQQLYNNEKKVTELNELKELIIKNQEIISNYKKINADLYDKMQELKEVNHDSIEGYTKQIKDNMTIIASEIDKICLEKISQTYMKNIIAKFYTSYKTLALSPMQMFDYITKLNLHEKLNFYNLNVNNIKNHFTNSNKKTFDLLLDIINKNIPSQTQSGGGPITDKFDKYTAQLNILTLSIGTYRTQINDFIKQAMDFNIRYIQLYNHQKFISTYIEFILFSDTYLIYKYLTRGTTQYYSKIVKKILDEIEIYKKKKGKNPIMRYFYIYHMVTLQILDSFLESMYKIWKDNSGGQTSTRNTTKIDVLDSSLEDNVKKGLFIFNFFKDILDAYENLTASQVSVYLRINDIVPVANSSFVKNNEILDEISINMCKTVEHLDREKVKKIKFKEIYDKEFEDNSILAQYMNIPTFLAKNKSIMLITYGYSGVGKTYTLFGTNKVSGLLQRSLTSIQNQDGIYMRVYEIYGKALPYKSYWNNNKKFDHEIIIYNNKGELTNSISDDAQIKIFLNNVKNQDTDTYSEISIAELGIFSKIVEDIDAIRKKEGRIKATVNNPVSSRSIMVYEFKIKIEAANYVRFVIMDLPGKENILKTYVEGDFTTLIKSGVNESEYKEGQIGITLNTKVTTGYYERAVKAAVFLNPLFISTFPIIATEIINHNWDIKNMEHLVKYKDQADVKHLQTKSFDKLNNVDVTVNSALSFKQNILDCIKAYEILINVINNGDLKKIIDFYDKIIFKTNTKKYAALPFEGYYINENILGLVNVFKKKVGGSSTVLIENYFSQMMDTESINVREDVKKLYYKDMLLSPKLIDIYKNELVAQTYFIRDFLRHEVGTIGSGNYLLSYGSPKRHALIDDANYNNIEYKSKKIKDIFEAAYDFNKSYTDTPPIEMFMNAYLEEDAVTKKKTIDNIYLFYVVNNTASCENQIKLIADSKDFIDVINNYGLSIAVPVTTT